MKYTNIEWKIKSPLYIRFRKHYCPKCNSLLRVIKVSRVVRIGSEEAKQLGADGRIGGVQYSGNIKVVWKEFECPDCKNQITIEEMKKIEGIM